MLQIGTNVRVNKNQGEFAGYIGTIVEIASGQVHFKNEREYRVRFRSGRKAWFRKDELEELPGKEQSIARNIERVNRTYRGSS